MGQAQAQHFCEACGKFSLHARPSFEFGWGCLLSLVTLGLFLPVWLAIKLAEHVASPWRCQDCGRKKERDPIWPVLKWAGIGLASLFGLAFLAALVNPRRPQPDLAPPSALAPTPKPTERPPEKAPESAVEPSELTAQDRDEAYRAYEEAARKRGEPTAAPAPEPPGPRTLQIGDNAVLELPGGQGVWLATRDEDWNDLIDAENEGAKGTPGSGAKIYRMAVAGRARKYPNGTRVRILKMSVFARFVEVTEGEDAGQSGWVQAEFVRPP